jgi:hypothetical protein
MTSWYDLGTYLMNSCKALKAIATTTMVIGSSERSSSVVVGGRKATVEKEVGG